MERAEVLGVVDSRMDGGEMVVRDRRPGRVGHVSGRGERVDVARASIFEGVVDGVARRGLFQHGQGVVVSMAVEVIN